MWDQVNLFEISHKWEISEKKTNIYSDWTKTNHTHIEEGTINKINEIKRNSDFGQTIDRQYLKQGYSIFIHITCFTPIVKFMTTKVYHVRYTTTVKKRTSALTAIKENVAGYYEISLNRK